MNFHRMIGDFCADILKDRRKEAAEENKRRKLANRTPKSARNLAKRKPKNPDKE